MILKLLLKVTVKSMAAFSRKSSFATAVLKFFSMIDLYI